MAVEETQGIIVRADTIVKRRVNWKIQVRTCLLDPATFKKCNPL